MSYLPSVRCIWEVLGHDFADVVLIKPMHCGFNYTRADMSPVCLEKFLCAVFSLSRTSYLSASWVSVAHGGAGQVVATTCTMTHNYPASGFILKKGANL